MDTWVILLFSLFIISILIGWIACWRSSLPFPQKTIWSILVLIFPVGGTIAYFLLAQDYKNII